MVEAWSHASANRAITRRRKKKLYDELKRLFPARFGEGGSRNQLERVRKFLNAKIAAVIDPTEEVVNAYKEAFGLLVGSQKPACFSESGSHVLVAMDKGFAKLLVAMAESGCPTPNELTVFEFYTWLDHLNDKYEASKPKPEQRGKR